MIYFYLGISVGSSQHVANREVHLRGGGPLVKRQRGKVQIPVLRQQTDPDGLEREGLYLRDKETLVEDHKIYLQMYRRTQLCTVLFTLVKPLAPDTVGNVRLSASRALET